MILPACSRAGVARAAPDIVDGWPPRTSGSSRRRVEPSRSRARTRSTSPSWAPRSSIWSRTTSRSPTHSTTRPAGGRPCSSDSREERGESPSSRSGSPPVLRSWLQTTVVSTPNGTTSNALVVADIAHVLWAVNLGCLGLHLWPYCADDPDHADELRIDLDPQPGTSFDEIRVAAAHVRSLLDELGIVGYPKTTGNRGIHIYVRLEPRWDSFEVRCRRGGPGPRARATVPRLDDRSTGGRKNGANASSSTSIRTHPTRRSSAHGSHDRGSAARSRRP